jgi:hypothetical protein
MGTLTKKPRRAKVIGSKYLSLQFDERIQELKNEIDRLESIRYLYDYFFTIRRMQNSYIVQMRKIVAKRLIAIGFSNSEVSRIVCRDHATVIHLRRKQKSSSEALVKEVMDNYEIWIKNREYPVTYTKFVPNHLAATGFTTVTKYKLKAMEENGQT